MCARVFLFFCCKYTFSHSPSPSLCCPQDKELESLKRKIKEMEKNEEQSRNAKLTLDAKNSSQSRELMRLRKEVKENQHSNMLLRQATEDMEEDERVSRLRADTDGSVADCGDEE